MDANARLGFLGIDSNCLNRLEEVGKHIPAEIDSILSDFYEKMLQSPDVARLFNGNSVHHAKSAQRQHWLQNVFAGRFDEDYMQRVTRIGRAHERVGLEPRWYMGGYCYVLNRLVDLLASKNRFSPARMAELIKAVNKAVFLDMELAVSVYIDTSKETARSTVATHAERFEGEVKGMVDLVASAATELRAVAEGMASVADRTAKQTYVVAQNADLTSDNVQTVAAATSELASSIDEISRQANAVRQSTADAVEDAASVREVVDVLTSAVKDIAEAARQVTDIASRTRLLALNATIESARAGEHGRGFAVVAGEVKSLADQAARVTDNIITRIASVEDATASASVATMRITSAIDRLHGVATAIAAAVDEQGAATAEIARSVSRAAEGTRSVTEVIGEVAGSANQTESSATHVLESSRSLSVNAEELSRTVCVFLDDVRAA